MVFGNKAPSNGTQSFISKQPASRLYIKIFFIVRWRFFIELWNDSATETESWVSWSKFIYRNNFPPFRGTFQNFQSLFLFLIYFFEFFRIFFRLNEDWS